jgi:hypothetical protein
MHEMGGFDIQKAREVFNIPEDFEVGIMIAIGYHDIHQVLPESKTKSTLTKGEKNPSKKLHF